VLCGVVAGLVLLLGGAQPAAAHPLGLPAFARLTATAQGDAVLVWNAAPDDIAALARSMGVEVAAGQVLTREQDAAFSSSAVLLDGLQQGLRMSQDGEPCAGEPAVSSIVERGVTMRFDCPQPARTVSLRITLLTELDVRYRTLASAAAPEGDQRFMFTATAPEHEFVLDPTASSEAPIAPPPPQDSAGQRQPFGGSLPFESRFVAVIDGSVAFGGLLLGLLIAFGVGAVHGLAPGHGKAIAAAYLVGDRGRPRDAVLLGSVVAAMHTWSVVALGFALYSATQRPATAALSAWLQLVTALVLVALGGWLVVRRLRERRHAAHDHGHGITPDVHPLSWKGIVALGAAGGLLPSPSALLVLFTALALDRLAYGLALIVVFSLGLAATLSVIGLAVLRGRDVLRARMDHGRVATVVRLLPLLGAGAVTALGVLMAASAIRAVVGAAAG
jgi:ABC-type nickel/cobalt efflux system permease component RcnA